MVDTVVLILSKDMYRISEPDKFVPSARWTENPSMALRGIQSKQNPTKKELRGGVYKPRLTLSSRINIGDRHEITLRIELSLPKLFFGNNFNELMRKDLVSLIGKLEATLSTMGIVTTEEILVRAPLSAIHYSKNIPLTDGSTPYHFINKIKEANLKLSLDVNQTDYRDGHSYKWHSNSYEVVFYDKIRDLEMAKKSSKRALEKDNDVQLYLFEPLQRRKKFEVLRIEVRVIKRQKIKQLFKTLGIKSDFTFKSLFKPIISKKVLLHYLDELESKRPALVNYKASSDKALLAALVISNPELGPKQVLQMFGLKRVLETVNSRELRVMFAKYNARSWYQLIADANKVRLPTAQSPFTILRDRLMKFKPLKLILQ